MTQARKRNWYGEVSPMTPDDWDNFFTFIHRHLTRRRRS
jgi:hypothetical protein